MRHFIPLIIFLILTLFFWKGLQKDPHNIPSPLIGKPVPAFQAKDLLNEAPLTNKIFRGKVSLLNVWATWCVTCYAEHTVLMNISSEKVTLYGLDYKDNKTDAKHFITTHGNPYQNIIFDDKGLIAIDFGVYGTPETFIIDKKGIIRYKHIGAVSPEDWKNTLKPLVEKLNRE